MITEKEAIEYLTKKIRHHKEARDELMRYKIEPCQIEQEYADLLKLIQRQSSELEFYKKEFSEMIESAKPLQCGGEYAHLLKLGDSIPAKAIPALLKEIERLKKQYEPKFKIGESAYWKICAKKIVICFIGEGCYLDQNYNFYPESDLFTTEQEALQSLEGSK